MFWKRKPAGEAEKAEPGELKALDKPKKLPGPSGIPQPVGRYLVVDLKQNPDWVWNLKTVLKPTEDKHIFGFRVYDETPRAVKGVPVRNYNSLDEYPDLILYQGRFNKQTLDVQVDEQKTV